MLAPQQWHGSDRRSAERLGKRSGTLRIMLSGIFTCAKHAHMCLFSFRPMFTTFRLDVPSTLFRPGDIVQVTFTVQFTILLHDTNLFILHSLHRSLSTGNLECVDLVHRSCAYKTLYDNFEQPAIQRSMQHTD